MWMLRHLGDIGTWILEYWGDLLFGCLGICAVG